MVYVPVTFPSAILFLESNTQLEQYQVSIGRNSGRGAGSESITSQSKAPHGLYSCTSRTSSCLSSSPQDPAKQVFTSLLLASALPTRQSMCACQAQLTALHSIVAASALRVLKEAFQLTQSRGVPGDNMLQLRWWALRWHSDTLPAPSLGSPCCHCTPAPSCCPWRCCSHGRRCLYCPSPLPFCPCCTFPCMAASC